MSLAKAMKIYDIEDLNTDLKRNGIDFFARGSPPHLTLTVADHAPFILPAKPMQVSLQVKKAKVPEALKDFGLILSAMNFVSPIRGFTMVPVVLATPTRGQALIVAYPVIMAATYAAVRRMRDDVLTKLGYGL